MLFPGEQLETIRTHRWSEFRSGLDEEILAVFSPEGRIHLFELGGGGTRRLLLEGRGDWAGDGGVSQTGQGEEECCGLHLEW